MPEFFPTSHKVIAPYWDDIALLLKGRVFYDLLDTDNGYKVLQTISTFINSVEKMAGTFQATSAVIIYWRDTCPYDNYRCSNVGIHSNMLYAH